MHEYVLTQNFISQIFQNHSKDEIINLDQIPIGVGVFSHENFDNMKFWWKELTKDTELEHIELVKTDIVGIIYCLNCLKEYEITEHPKDVAWELVHDIACPNCGSFTTEVRQGTEILILKK